MHHAALQSIRGLIGLLLFAMVALPSAATAAAPPVVVGYLPHYRAGSWSPERIGPVTDLVLFAAQPRADGSLDASQLSARLLEKARAAKRANGCRLLLCIGGWDRSSHFATVVADQVKRGKLVGAIADYCQRHHLDGVDLDWEHPRDAAQRRGYGQLLSEIKAKLAPRGGIVTVAMSPSVDLGQAVYDVVDRVHLMSYDHAFPQATLEKSRQDLRRLTGYGCPAVKVALGVPFYGRNAEWKAKTYGQLARDKRPAGDQVDGYAFNGPATVVAKLKLAEQQRLAGVMIWELGQDRSNVEHSLLRTIEQTWPQKKTSKDTEPNDSPS